MSKEHTKMMVSTIILQAPLGQKNLNKPMVDIWNRW